MIIGILFVRSGDMKKGEMDITMRDGHEIHLYKWEPDEGDIKGVIQLVHGSCEHAGRYIDFGEFMTKKGYIVYANDHRGHGKSVKTRDELGYFGENDGWTYMIGDLYEINRMIKKEHSGSKIIMLGHSMGSFLARHFGILHGSEIDGLIATGTAHNPKALLKLGKFLAERDIKKGNIKRRNLFLNRLSYESFNDKFKPNRTKQDWLTRDKEVVDAFLQDELCGYVFTSGGFRDMFDGLLYITDESKIRMTPKELPILLLSGGDDPVGGYGSMVEKAFKCYKEAGIKNIKMKLYHGMRHEILNEIGKKEVYEDILSWIKNNII